MYHKAVRANVNMENNKSMDAKKKLPLLIGVGVLILAVIIILALSAKKPAVDPDSSALGTQTPTGQNAESGEEVESSEVETVAIEVNPVLEGARIEAPGANLITTEGKVVNESGELIRSDVEYNSPYAPKQTQAISLAEVPLANKLTLGANGFEPKEFRVKKGQAVTVALTGSEDSSHVFAFESPLLSAVYINVRPGETRAVTFNAPDVAGEYVFFCDFPGHRARGEEGKMIVE